MRECARRNVRSVVQMQCDKGAFDVTERLRIVGVDVRTERTPMGIGPDEVAHGTYAIVDGWYDGNLSKRVPADGYFGRTISAVELLGLPG